MASAPTPFSHPVYHSPLTRPKRSDKMILDERLVRFEPTPGTHVLAVQTAPRPVSSSLSRTLDSLEVAGLARWAGPKLLISDGCTPDTPQGWTLDAGEAPPKGSAKTFLRLLRKALEVAPDLTRLTYIQDDVVLAKSGLDYINDVALDEDLVLLSWFACWWAKPEKNPKPSIGISPVRRFKRSQAVTIPRSSIDKLLSSAWASKWPYRHGCDMFFAHVMGSRVFGTHYPNIAQHTDGTNSACGHSKCGERASASFVGQGFDVLSLKT